MLVGGGRTYEISPEDYIYAAMSIYVDIIGLFIHILELLKGLDDMAA